MFRILRYICCNSQKRQSPYPPLLYGHTVRPAGPTLRARFTLPSTPTSHYIDQKTNTKATIPLDRKGLPTYWAAATRTLAVSHHASEPRYPIQSRPEASSSRWPRTGSGSNATLLCIGQCVGRQQFFESRKFLICDSTAETTPS